jgi:hypothetical protein
MTLTDAASGLDGTARSSRASLVGALSSDGMRRSGAEDAPLDLTTSLRGRVVGDADGDGPTIVTMSYDDGIEVLVAQYPQYRHDDN